MKRRVPFILGLPLMALLWTSVHAQDNVVTNASQLAAILDRSDVSLSLAEPGMFIPTLDIFWVDFGQLTNAVGNVRDSRGQTQYEVMTWPVRLTRSASGTAITYPWSETLLLQVPAPPDDDFSTQYSTTLSAFCVMLGKNPPCEDDPYVQGYLLDPARLVVDVWLGDINDYSTYASNVTAMAEADAECGEEGQAGEGGFVMIEEDEEGDGGDLCSVTNLTQAFLVTSIAQDTNTHFTTVTWQSCPVFRYIVLSADELSTNTVWLPRAYVWGQTNTYATSWTDVTTTNLTHRFYKVERINGSPISAGGLHSLALRPDGSLWTWGDGDDGKLGDGTYGDPLPFYSTLDSFVGGVRPSPVEVADRTSCVGQTITNATALACGGESFSVVADADGRVWTWGGAITDEIGIGDAPFVLGDGGLRNDFGNIDILVPSPISGISNVVSVAAGYEHTLALRTDGTVFAWGLGDAGQLGTTGPLDPNCNLCTNAPAQCAGLTQVVAIAAGANHSVVLDINGRVYTFGNGSLGQLGNGGITNLTVPAIVTGISNVIAIAAGFDHTLAVTADKTLWTWGNNSSGQLGRSGSTLTPGQVPPSQLSNVVGIAGGYKFSLAVTTNGNGRVYAWGDNSDGQLGTNTAAVASTNRPMLVASISNAVLVSASVGQNSGEGVGGAYHSMAMSVDQGTNHYWGWGENDYGQVGNGTNGNGATQYVPASVQFCTRCERCVQLGTSGSFTAQCTGTLVLYFNDDTSDFPFLYSDNAGSYTVTVNSVTTNVPAYADYLNPPGVAVGTVVKGSNYTFSASGFCIRNNAGDQTDANGNGTNGIPASCSSINITNTICPTSKCFSLVGKIQ